MENLILAKSDNVCVLVPYMSAVNKTCYVWKPLFEEKSRYLINNIRLFGTIDEAINYATDNLAEVFVNPIDQLLMESTDPFDCDCEDKWYKFYKGRVNSTYQEYFNQKYEPFLLYISDTISTTQNLNCVIDVGCGIGSVIKYLYNHAFYKGIHYVGMDKSNEVLKLAKDNLGGVSDIKFVMADILDLGDALYPKPGWEELIPNKDRLCVTHGVLEHFSDCDIKHILKTLPNSIHYVPLDRYKEPSFGDERLLPVDHWIKLADPKYYTVFNDGHDLFFHTK